MTVTMFGCVSRAMARASRRKRSTYSGSREKCSWMILSATERSSTLSRALKTLDIPPVPRSSSTSKRSATSWPIILPGSFPPGAGLHERLLERVFPDAERLVELGVGDDERRQDADAVAVDAGLEQEEAALRSRLDDGGGEVGGRLAFLTDLDREHRAEAADVGNGREAFAPVLHARADRLADLARALSEALLGDNV